MKRVVVDCRKRPDGTFDVFEFASTWSGFQIGAGVSRAEAWRLADRTILSKGQKLSVRGLGRRLKGE